MGDKSKRILVIDDEPSLHEMLRVILELGGYQAVGNLPGTVGGEELAEAKPDLIVLDLMMPDVDGFEILRRLKGDEETRHIPVVICSVRDYPEDHAMAQELGAARYITKPFEPSEFLEVIGEVLQETDAA
jgi:DNA-binding response OmpR family regulator